MKYEEVVLIDGTRFKWRFVGENGLMLRGIEVNDEGEPIKPRDADERLRLVHKGVIGHRSPLRMNLTHGELEYESS